MKPLHKSRTLWLNVAVGLIAISSEVAAFIDVIRDDDIVYTLRLINSLALMFGNIIMRILTEDGVYVIQKPSSGFDDREL